MTPTMLVALALAGTPGRAVTAPPCVDATCDGASRALERFQADISLDQPPQRARVRLGHLSGDLVVRVDALPPGYHAEVTLLQTASDDLTHVAAFADDLTVGTHVIPTTPKVQSGDERAAYVGLVRDGKPEARWTWTPSGDPDPRRAFPVVFSSVSTEPHGLRTSVIDGQLRADAPGAFRLSVTHQRTLDAVGRSHEAGPPWHREAVGEHLIAPMTGPPGTYQVQARWLDSEGLLDHITATHETWNGAVTPALGTDWRPDPLLNDRRTAAPFDLSSAASICVEDADWLAAAALLHDEALRLHGVTLTANVCGTARADITIRRGAGPGDGFSVDVTPDTVIIDAGSLRGAVYAALALVDAAAASGHVAPGVVTDAPELDQRWFFWTFDARRFRDGFPMETWRHFVRTVLARGRYSGLVLGVRDGYAYESHPELRHRGALDRAELTTLLDAARELGLDVLPGLNTPSHDGWLLAQHPELAESNHRDMVCTRHPDLDGIVEDLTSELIDVFGAPKYFHIGGDEVRWSSLQRREDARCPRCEGTPRAVLYGDHVAHRASQLLARGVTPVMWADMLLPGWNGRREGLSDAVERWPAAVREGTLVMPWTDIGGGVDAVRDLGLSPMFGLTGDYDPRRAPLARAAADLPGAAFAEFWPYPWDPTTYGFGEGEAYGFAHVLLAGWTMWRPALAPIPAATLLTQMVGTSALHPGFNAALAGRARPLPHLPTGARFPSVMLPSQATVAGGTFTLGQPSVAVETSPLTWRVSRRLTGASFLQAVVLSRDAELTRTQTAARSSGAQPPAAWLEITYDSDEVVRIPWRLGRETGSVTGRVAVAALFDTAGTLRLASPDGDPRTFHRVDWINPRPQEAVKRLRVVAETGVRVGIIGATAIR